MSIWLNDKEYVDSSAQSGNRVRQLYNNTHKHICSYLYRQYTHK